MTEDTIIPEGFQEKEDLTTTALKANIVAIVMALPLMLAASFAYYFVHVEIVELSTIVQIRSNAPLMLAVMILGIVIHELLHGFGWSLFAQNGFKSIRFGVIWRMLTPYCHCKEPLQLGAYLFGGLLPALVLGIIPTVVALIIGSQLWFVFGLFFTLAAGGDFLIAWMLRKQKKNDWVQDHPNKIGCLILERKDTEDFL